MQNRLEIHKEVQVSISTDRRSRFPPLPMPWPPRVVPSPASPLPSHLLSSFPFEADATGATTKINEQSLQEYRTRLKSGPRTKVVRMRGKTFA